MHVSSSWWQEMKRQRAGGRRGIKGRGKKEQKSNGRTSCIKAGAKTYLKMFITKTLWETWTRTTINHFSFRDNVRFHLLVLVRAEHSKQQVLEGMKKCILAQVSEWSADVFMTYKVLEHFNVLQVLWICSCPAHVIHMLPEKRVVVVMWESWREKGDKKRKTEKICDKSRPTLKTVLCAIQGLPCDVF